MKGPLMLCSAHTEDADTDFEEQTGGTFHVPATQSPVSVISAGLGDETQQGVD